MRLTFLGTGPSNPIPRPGHRDPLCRDARMNTKSARLRSSAYLENGAYAVLLDAGPDVERQLERLHPSRIDAVFLTHGHADAAGGLRLLDRWLARHIGGRPVPVVTDPATARRLAAKFGGLARLRPAPVRPYGRVSIGGATVTCLPVRHSLTPGFATFGYAWGRRFAYASDVAGLPSRTAALLERVDTLVLDAACWFGTTIPSHLRVDEAARLAADLGVRRLVLTQIGHSYPPHDQAVRELRRRLRSPGTAAPAEVVLAHDGLRLTVV